MIIMINILGGYFLKKHKHTYHTACKKQAKVTERMTIVHMSGYMNRISSICNYHKQDKLIKGRKDLTSLDFNGDFF